MTDEGEGVKMERDKRVSLCRRCRPGYPFPPLPRRSSMFKKGTELDVATLIPRFWVRDEMLRCAGH
eukprot:3869165-Prymnesium_polylepis.1